MSGIFNGPSRAAPGSGSTDLTFDWVIDSLGKLQPAIIDEAPAQRDPIVFERIFEPSDQSSLISDADTSPGLTDRGTRSDSAAGSLALASYGEPGRSQAAAQHLAWTSETDSMSWHPASETHTPQRAQLHAAPVTQMQSGGIFGTNGETHANGADKDDVFFEVKYVVTDNVPRGWSSEPSYFFGEGGNDTFYTVDGLGYQGVDTDYFMDHFNGGTGTDTVSYVRASVGAAINLQDGIGYRFGQSLNHPTEYYRSFDKLTSIENATGSQHADRMRGDWQDNVLHGLGGNDVMWGGLGDDTMRGGAGDDAMRGEDHDDLIYGDDGKDRLWGGAGEDEIHGGAGNDAVSGGTGDDRIHGDTGGDKLHGNDGADTIYGGAGDDTIDGGNGDDHLHGGGGYDVIRAGWGQDRITLGDGGTAWGDQGEDVIHGSNSRDLIHGGAHDDDLFGWVGNDEMHGGSGNDNIYGGDGFDTASYASAGGAVGVFLSATGGFASGGAGNDQLFSIESVIGSDFGDVLSGNDATNTLLGGRGNDIIAGNGGLDIIKGEAGNDDLRGGSGGDIMLGGDGRDKMSGGSGSDVMSGGDGDDRIRGGDGLDQLTGGAGADLFVFAGGDTGADTITDFEVDTDRIIFDDFLANAPGAGESYVGEVYAFFADQPENSVLMARTQDGWQHVATLNGIGVNTLADAMADGSLFHGSSDGLGGGPGGWAPVEGDHLPFAQDHDLMFG